MASGIETTLRIKGIDDTGGAFAALKAHIASLDKQIGTFDKLMVSAGRVAKANDPLIASINKSSIALKEERAALAAVGEGMAASVASTERAAGSQAAFATEIARATEVMVVQGREAGRVAGQVARRRSSDSARARGGSRPRCFPLRGRSSCMKG